MFSEWTRTEGLAELRRDRNKAGRKLFLVTLILTTLLLSLPLTIMLVVAILGQIEPATTIIGAVIWLITLAVAARTIPGLRRKITSLDNLCTNVEGGLFEFFEEFGELIGRFSRKDHFHLITKEFSFRLFCLELILKEMGWTTTDLWPEQQAAVSLLQGAVDRANASSKNTERIIPHPTLEKIGLSFAEMVAALFRSDRSTTDDFSYNPHSIRRRISKLLSTWNFHLIWEYAISAVGEAALSRLHCDPSILAGLPTEEKREKVNNTQDEARERAVLAIRKWITEEYPEALDVYDFEFAEEEAIGAKA